MLSFIAGLMIGGLIGVVTMWIMVAAKEADRHIEACECEAIEEHNNNTACGNGSGEKV